MSVDRPATSKSRGICRYYDTPRGCFAGDSCKFKHGEQEQLTPYDKSKACKFFAAGYCRRGAKCWFRHVQPEASTSALPVISSPKTPADSAADEEEEDYDNLCSICFERPITYGLLAGCSHIFCVQCIRVWRDPSGKSEDVVESGNTKKCPLCRAPSRFVTPSSRFYPDGDPGKTETIEKYKASMARVPCKYFRESPVYSRFCPFGKDCFYQHLKEDGTPYLFDHGVEYYMPIYLRRTRRGQFAGDNSGSGQFFNHLEDFGATIDAIRASLPDFLNQLHFSGDDDNPEVVWDDSGDERRPDTPRPASEDGGNADLMQRLVHSVSEFWSATQHGILEEDMVTFRFADAFVDDVTDQGLVQAGSYTDFLLPADIAPPVDISFMPSWAQTQSDGAIQGVVATPPVDIDVNRAADLRHSTIASEASSSATALDALREALLRDSSTAESSSVQEEGAFSEATSDDDDDSSDAAHDEDPPFMTDGRGRVVWSSTSEAQAQVWHHATPPKARYELTSSGAAAPLPPRVSREMADAEEERASGFVTDGRGRVVSTGGFALKDDTDSADESGDSDEDEDEEAASPSLLGRLWNAFFL